MSNNLRRSQSLKNLPGTQNRTFATPCGPLVDKRKTVSQLVQQYQSYSRLRDIDLEDHVNKTSVLFRTNHEKTHNSNQSISWKRLASVQTGAYSGLTRSLSTDTLPSRNVKGTDALRALFEPKSPVNSSVRKDKTYNQYYPVKDVCSACLKEVYPVEKIVADKCILHINCFCCKHCKTKLSMHRYSTIYGDFYCTSHYQQLFKRNGNYDEGFGYQQHKDQWLTKKADQTSEIKSSSLSPNCQPTCLDSAAMVQNRISKEDRRVNTKVCQDIVKKLNITWPPENKQKKKEFGLEMNKNLPYTKQRPEYSSIKTSRESLHSTNKVHPVQQTRIVKETRKQSSYPTNGMKNKYTGIPFEPKLCGEVKRVGSTFQHNKIAKTKTELDNVKPVSKHDATKNVVSKKRSCTVFGGELRNHEDCSDAIFANKLNENTLRYNDGPTKGDNLPSNYVEELQEPCMEMSSPQSATKLNETLCNISSESLPTVNVELTANEVCISLEKKNNNMFNEDPLEVSSTCSDDGPTKNVILPSITLEELQAGCMNLPPVDVCDGLEKKHPLSISDDTYMKSDIHNSDHFPKKKEESESNIDIASNDNTCPKTSSSKENPDFSHPDKSSTNDLKTPQKGWELKAVNKSTSKGVSPISKLFPSGPNEKGNTKQGTENVPKRVNKLERLLSKPFNSFTKKEKCLEKTQYIKTIPNKIPPEEKKKERTQEDKEKCVDDEEHDEGNKMNTEKEMSMYVLGTQDENNGAFLKTDMSDVAAFPQSDPGTLDQTPDNNSNLAAFPQSDPGTLDQTPDNNSNLTSCKKTIEKSTESAKEHDSNIDMMQEDGQNSTQNQTRHHDDIFDASELETEAIAEVKVDVNICSTDHASSESTKGILETSDQKSAQNDIADLNDTIDSQSPADGDVLASQYDNFSHSDNTFDLSGFEMEATVEVEVDVNSNIFTNAFVDIFDQKSEVTTMRSDQKCSQNDISIVSKSNQSSVEEENVLTSLNDHFSHHADILNTSELETRATEEVRVYINSNIATNASNDIFETENASFENTKFILETSDQKSTQNDISDLISTNDSQSSVAGGKVLASQNDHFSPHADIFNLSRLETEVIAEVRVDVNSNIGPNDFNDIFYTEMTPDQKCSQNSISDSNSHQSSVAGGNMLPSQSDLDIFLLSGLEMEATDQNSTPNDIPDLIITNDNQSSVDEGNVQVGACITTHAFTDIFDTASSFSEIPDQKSTQNAIPDQSPVAGGNVLASQNKHFMNNADIFDSSVFDIEATEVGTEADSKIATHVLNDIFEFESASSKNTTCILESGVTIMMSDQKSTKISDQHTVTGRNMVASEDDYFDLFDSDTKKSDVFDQNNPKQENSQFVQNDFLDIFSFDHVSSTHVINGPDQSKAASETQQFIQSEATDSLSLNNDSSSALWQPSKPKPHQCPESLESVVLQNADNGAVLSTLTLEPSRNTSDIFIDPNLEVQNVGDTLLLENFTVSSTHTTQTNESIASKEDWLKDFLG